MSRDAEPPWEGGPDEAAAFIAEAVSELTRLAKTHELEMLGFLLEMVKMEADERIRLRSKKKLS